MALLQIQRGAFPRRYGIRTTNYQYIERGQRQTKSYVYSETDTSIVPDSTYMPTINMSQVCGVGDPTLFAVQLSNTIGTPTWTENHATRTWNAGTQYEFSLDVITGMTANISGVLQPLASVSFGSSSTTVQHYVGQDYHDYSGVGTATVRLDSNGNWTSDCLITGARSKLHVFYKKAIIVAVYETPTIYHYELAGYEDAEYVSNSPMSGTPIAPCEIQTHTAYNCAVSLSYTT